MSNEQAHLAPEYARRVAELEKLSLEKVIEAARQTLSFGGWSDVKVVCYALITRLEEVRRLHEEALSRLPRV